MISSKTAKKTENGEQTKTLFKPVRRHPHNIPLVWPPSNSKKKKIMFFKLVLGVFQLYRMLLFRSNDSARVMNIEKDSHNKHEGGIKNIEVYLLRL